MTTIPTKEHALVFINQNRDINGTYINIIVGNNETVIRDTTVKECLDTPITDITGNPTLRERYDALVLFRRSKMGIEFRCSICQTFSIEDRESFIRCYSCKNYICRLCTQRTYVNKCEQCDEKI